MHPFPPGYWQVKTSDVEPGTRYKFQLDNSIERPDPASHWQPDGVHLASAVVDHTAFTWNDASWQGYTPEEMVLYEVHVGCFSPQGTFDGIIERLDELQDLGVTALEIMPVAQFPGLRNWGYDGVHPFAVQQSYGGPFGFKRLVDTCHTKGIALVLDVVYNHLGPEGNYLRDFGHYFTKSYTTPWGDAVNVDGAHSNDVRNFFIENALFWLREYHIDALRLDAVHAICDMSARTFLRDLADAVERFSLSDGRQRYLLAESDQNDSRIIRSPAQGGYGLNALWSDDFHHALHALVTGERRGYYSDYGTIPILAKAYSDSFAYDGCFSAYRRRDHGNTAADRPPSMFVVYTQNHDQVGNRMMGERLSSLVSFESLKLAAATVILSPYIPMLFMGEEYAEQNPFLYFANHSDTNLIDATRNGRSAEFAAFHNAGMAPDPFDAATFEKSKLHWEQRYHGASATMLSFYKMLLRLRKNCTAFIAPHRERILVQEHAAKQVIVVKRWYRNCTAYILHNFSDSDTQIEPVDERFLQVAFDSADLRFNGPGSLVSGHITPKTALTLRARSACVLTHTDKTL